MSIAFALRWITSLALKMQFFLCLMKKKLYFQLSFVHQNCVLNIFDMNRSLFVRISKYERFISEMFNDSSIVYLFFNWIIICELMTSVNHSQYTQFRSELYTFCTKKNENHILSVLLHIISLLSCAPPKHIETNFTNWCRCLFYKIKHKLIVSYTILVHIYFRLFPIFPSHEYY